MSNWERLQALASGRYKQDVPGALKRALENNSPGSTGGETDTNGLARIAFNAINDPDRPQGAGTEWAEPVTFAAITLVLTVAPAP